MKTNQLYNEDFPLELLERSVKECTRNVSWKNDVAKWRGSDRMKYIIALKEELDNHTYHLGPYKTFIVTEPKRREIHSPLFRDRVVQRAMCINGVYNDLMKDSILDSCACQKKKGVLFAMNRLSHHLNKYYNIYNINGYIIKLDIHHFFKTIPHDLLHLMVDEKVYNSYYRSLIHEIIDSFDDPGIGLGCQICQILANSYLNPYDHFIKENLKCHGYIRYSDDMIILSKSKKNALNTIISLNCFLSNLKLQLNEKSNMFPIEQGVIFLKFHFKFKNGRILKCVCKKSARRYWRHLLKQIKQGLSKGYLDICIQSWKSRMKQGDNNKIIYKLIRRFNQCVK